MENEALKLMYADMINFSSTHLAQLRGQAKCSSKTIYELTLDELTNQISESFNTSDPNYKEALYLFTSKIRHDKAFREAGLNYRYDGSRGNMFLSSDEQHVIVPFGCKMQLFYQAYWYMFLLLALCLGVGNFYIYKAWNSIKMRQKAQGCYRKIMEDLQGSLKIRVRDLKSRLKGAGVSRGNVDDVWKLINQIRRNDEYIYVIEEEYDGVYEEMWTMKAGEY